MALDHQNTPDQDEDPVSFMDQHRGKIIQAVITLTIIAGLTYAFLGPKDDRSNVKNFFSDCKPVNGACKQALGLLLVPKRHSKFFDNRQNSV